MVSELLGNPTLLASLHPQTALVVRTIRIWAGLRMARRCPLEMAESRFGSLEAASALHRLVAEMSAAWPDPIAIAPPCCPVLSHDEATLAALLTAAASDHRLAFDREAEDMLDEDARGRLWTEMRAILAAVRA